MSDLEVIEFIPEFFEEIARLTGYDIEELARIHEADLGFDHVRYVLVNSNGHVNFHVERRIEDAG